MWVPGSRGKVMFKDRRLMPQKLRHETGWIPHPDKGIDSWQERMVDPRGREGAEANVDPGGEVTARGPLLSKASLAS